MDPQITKSNDHMSKLFSDYEHLIKNSNEGPKLPPITIAQSEKILRSLRANVSDLYSITANHFINAGPIGIQHFHFLLSSFISDVNSIQITEVNSAYACILFKGHGKDISNAQSYRTISTCPLIAKGLDVYVRQLELPNWDAVKPLTQYQGEGSSHELAVLLLTETILHGLYTLDSPVYVIYIDAKNCFDSVLKELLILELFSAGTCGESLTLINNRLSNRRTYLEWGNTMMGP